MTPVKEETGKCSMPICKYYAEIAPRVLAKKGKVLV